MSSIMPFKINNTEKLYYNMKDLYNHKPDFFYGCTSKKRLIIKKKNIQPCEYVYANYFTKTNEWKLSDESCKKAQLLFTQSWTDRSFFNIKSAIENDVQEDEPTSVETAPPVLELNDEEKFRDCDGNIVDIEVIGEKSRNKILFNLNDVMKAFDMPSLDQVLRDDRKSYDINIHYKSFIKVTRANGASNSIKKRLYLTYKGLLKVLFNSRTGNAEQFQDWAEAKLFTIQMGTQENKEILGTDILGINIKNYRAVFNKHSSDFPCVYLLSLGKVGDVRDTFNLSCDIDDNTIVYKYGFTHDFKERIAKHQTDYGKMNNVKLDVVCFNIVDSKYTSEAENEIRDFFKAFNKPLEVNGRRELVSLNKMELDETRKKFIVTGQKYAGSTVGYENRIKLLENTINNLQHEMKIKDMEFKLELFQEKTEKEKLQTLVETNARVYTLEKSNYELRLNKC